MKPGEHHIFVEQGSRSHMEDVCGCYDFEGVRCLCVCDGHGGVAVAKLVSETLGPEFARIVRFEDDEVQLTTGITRRTLEYDTELHRKYRYVFAGQGTTLSACVCDPFKQKLVLINVGDSRTIIFNKTGLLAETFDHLPSFESERQRISKSGGFVTPATSWDVARTNGLYSLSRSLGDFSSKYVYQPTEGFYYSPESAPMSAKPDVSVLDISKEEQVYSICGSDGFWGLLRMPELVQSVIEQINTASNLRVFFKQLVNHLAAKPGSDNTSVIFARIK